MTGVFPHQPTVDHAPSERTDVVVDDDESADVLRFLSSETAREILGTLRDEPATASEIADSLDTSLQNIQYHLDRLRQADLIEPVETWYSSKGREMTVYGLTTQRLVVRFGGRNDAQTRRLRVNR